MAICSQVQKASNISTMKKNIIICIIGIVIGFGIRYIIYLQNKEMVAKTLSANPMNIARKSVIQNGDLFSYDMGLDRHFCIDYFKYAIIMANKYHWRHAYYDYYLFYLALPYKHSKLCCQQTIYYLKKGAELGDAACMLQLATIYKEGKYTERNFTVSKKYQEMYNAMPEWKRLSYMYYDENYMKELYE